MSRSLTAGMAAGIVAGTVAPILLFEAEFATSTERYWTGIGSISWNGQVWRGVGNLIEVSPIEETDDVKAAGVAVRVSGASIGAIEQSLGEMRGGKPGSIRFGLLDAAGNIVDSPKIMFRGRLDLVEIDDENPEQPLLVMSYENEIVDLERPREWRYTDQHQRQLFPGDSGFRHTPYLMDKTVIFGRR